MSLNESAGLKRIAADGDESSYLGINYSAIISVVVEAVKELNQKVEDMEIRLTKSELDLKNVEINKNGNALYHHSEDFQDPLGNANATSKKYVRKSRRRLKREK